MSLIITKPDGTSLDPVAFTIERGGGSAKLSVRIWNIGEQPVAGAFMALYAEIAPGQVDTSGHPVTDEIMVRFEVTGQDSTATPGQEILTGNIQPMGYLTTPQLPTILAGDWILADIWLEQPSLSAGGGA